MEELAASISSNSAILIKALQDEGHSIPQLHENGPVFFPLLSPEGSRARFSLISAAEEILRLATGPFEYLNTLSSRCAELGTLKTLVNLGIPQMIPLEESVSYSHLARETGVSEDLLTRLVRYSTCFGFLAESNGQVKHSPMSSIYVRDNIGSDCITWNLNVAFPSSTKMLEAIKLDPKGDDETCTPLSFAISEPGKPRMTIWDYHQAHLDDGRRFHSSMTAASLTSMWSPEHVVRGFDWNQVSSVVDIGGSEGSVCLGIAKKFPHIKFTVQDVGEVINSSSKALSPKYSNIISFAEHDFFQPQPIIADCYLLRFILHNWSDTDAKRILKNLLPALRPGARVIIVDNAVPVSCGTPSHVENLVRNLDVTMYTLLAGKERTEGDFVQLAESVDSRLELEYCRRPDGSLPSVFVFRFVGR